MTTSERRLLLMMAKLLVWMINAKSNYAIHPDVVNLERTIGAVEHDSRLQR